MEGAREGIGEDVGKNKNNIRHFPNPYRRGERDTQYNKSEGGVVVNILTCMKLLPSCPRGFL